MRKIRVIDSHTGGEPTRVIVSGGPHLGTGPIQERLDRFRENFDHIRSAVVNEPRGNDAIVGHVVTEAAAADQIDSQRASSRRSCIQSQW